MSGTWGGDGPGEGPGEGPATAAEGSGDDYQQPLHESDLDNPSDPFDPESGAPDDEEALDADEQATPTRAERKKLRSARVRRRRRIVAVVAGALLVLVLAFALWYELEANALGPAGRQVVITVHDGESTDSVIDALSQNGVIGSSWAFRFSDVFHGAPTAIPGSYALHQNQTFSEVRAILAAGPNIYPVDVLPGYTLNEVGAQIDSLPGHVEGGFRAEASSGVVHSAFSPPGSNNLEGMLGTGTYLILPGEKDVTIVQDMVQRFDHDAEAAGLSTASASALGLTPYQVIIAASIVEKEGYIPVNMPDTARVIYNRLANDMPLQMDSTVLYAARPGRWAGHVAGPADPVALQHLPQQRPDPDTDLHAVAGRLERGRPSASRRLALLRPGAEERRHGLLGHLRRAAGQRETGAVPWPALSRRARRPPHHRHHRHRTSAPCRC